MKHIYTSVDIGSDSIKVVVCELVRNKLNLLATSSYKSKGIKKGLIVDVDAASKSLKGAITDVEEMLGIEIKRVIASIPTYFAEFNMIRGSVYIEADEGSETGTVTGKTIVSCLQAAMVPSAVASREMVTIIPIDFKVDGNDAVTDPKGLVGSSLSVRAIMVTTPKKNIYSVVSLIENLGLEVVDISINSIGDAYAFKNRKMDSEIGVIVNIGSEVTSVSIYNKGIIVRNSVLQFGGRNIDNDLAYVYKIANSEAIRMKEKFALAHTIHASTNDIYEVIDLNGEKKRVSQYEASEVVMARIEDILGLVKKEISLLTKKEIEYIIITGGTSNMLDFDAIAEDVFKRKITMGNIKLIGVRNNKFSSAVGNIVYFINKIKLKGIDYTMISKKDMEVLGAPSKSEFDISNESMLGKVFGYFFND